MNTKVQMISRNWLILLIPIMVPLFTYVKNYIETPLGIFIRAIFISIILFACFILFCLLIFRNPEKAIFFASIVFLLLSSYGAVYDLLAKANHVLGHHRILAILFVIAVLGFAFLVHKIRIDTSLILAIKIIGIVFISLQMYEFFPLLSSSGYGKNLSDYYSFSSNYQESIQEAQQKSNDELQDVYYIILDSYARNDIIKEDFSFDNGDFADSLSKLGFYVADCSRSNYMITRSSLSSSLNMIYLSEVITNTPPSYDRDEVLASLIKQSSVFRQFDEIGYKTIAFETGYDFTEIKEVDDYLETQKPIAFLGSIDPFEIMLLKSSIFKIIYDTHIPIINKLFDQITFPHTNHVKLQLFMFEQLEQISRDPDPTFTFAHFTVPHTPFVFRADGSITTDRRYFSGLHVTPVSNELFIEGYINQIQFVNKSIINTIRKIFENSENPPIIIIQGDHGAILEHRFPILNAYYFPEGFDSNLYSSISPVNSFRMVFNNYYGLDFPMLEDKSFFANYESPYDWTIVNEEMEGCRN